MSKQYYDKSNNDEVLMAYYYGIKHAKDKINCTGHYLVEKKPIKKMYNIIEVEDKNLIFNMH